MLDDGWFGGRRDDHRGLGDWQVSADVWPDGLGPLVDHVKGLGMEFGLWFEPEMVNLDSDVARAHPEWVLGPVAGAPLPSRHQHVLDLANPDAYTYVLEAMSEEQVSVENETRPLERPFMVVATQNPIESEGTYALPEAQVDRFMLKVLIGYPSAAEEFVVVERQISAAVATVTVLDPKDGSLADYLNSLDRLEAAGAGKTVLPGHGADLPDTAEVARLYRAHRRQRLDQVRAALAEIGDDAKPMQVVRHVYSDVDKKLWPAARMSVKTQLAYLREN